MSRTRTAIPPKLPRALALLVPLALACGGGASSGPGITVAVSPETARVEASGTVQFTASVEGAADAGVAWSVAEAAGCGAVSAAGLYAAPAAAATCHVVATSAADGTRIATATVEVFDGVAVTVSPAAKQLLTGASVALTATVAHADDARVTWTASAGTVDADGVFTAPHTLGPVTVTATSVADPTRSATASISVVEVPTLSITLDGGKLLSDINKDKYLAGTLSLDARDGDAAHVLSGVAMKIKGRGNSTWTMPKKPFKVKLGAAASLLGMPADVEWALLANYSDKTLMRNSVAMELGRRLGFAWTPRSRFVELTLNGAYQGTYLLIETVKVAPARVDVTAMGEDDDSGDALTGGYLLERDGRMDGDVAFRTTAVYSGGSLQRGNEPYVVKEPQLSDMTAQAAYIQGYVQQAEDALYSTSFADPATGYAAYLDVDSAVAFFLVNETLKNVDSTFSSFYYSKDRLGKLRMGPLWDFDLAIGNADYYGAELAEGWYVGTVQPEERSRYFVRLLEDPAFAAAVRARWDEVKATQLDTLGDYIDETAAYLAHAQANNFATWPILADCVWPNPDAECVDAPPTYAGKVQYMKDFLAARIAWIDANL